MKFLPFVAALLPAVCLSVCVMGQTPAVSPIVKPKAENPENAGRLRLTQYLDGIAEKDLQARAAKVAGISTRAAAEARQKMVKAKILSLMGGLPERTPLKPQVVGTTQAEGFRIEKVMYESQPGFPVTALLYVPEGKQGKLPAIVVAPGHGAPGKASDVGFASAFAKNGFVVLSYDPIGQGERLQYPDPANPGQSLATRPTGEHGEAGIQPTVTGDAIARYFLWDGMRAVDYLLTRPEVDGERIGAFGCSGGGAMTALLGGMDTRVKAVGTACYITSFDTLLPSIGPQDAEQSIPGFIASGMDFPDWVELAAPKPYAIIATTEDMFPFAGAKKSEAEARRFYGLFGADAGLEFLTGPGGHGNLGPIQERILRFFIKNLQPGADASHPVMPPPRQPGRGPQALPFGVTKEALQVTSSGQVATSVANPETVHTLNLKRAEQVMQHAHGPKTLVEAQKAVREVTKAEAMPGATHGELGNGGDTASVDGVKKYDFTFESEGAPLLARLEVPGAAGRHAAVLLVAAKLEDAPLAQRAHELAKAGSVVLTLVPRPSPAGTEETKSPLLGDFYLTELRAELLHKTILGMRVDDVIHAVDALAARKDVDPKRITAQASGHMGLVLLHAAVLDPRLQHVTVDHALASYKSLVEAPLTRNAPQDVLPGVLKRYDVPDLVRVLGARITWTEPLPGTEDLGWRAAQ